MCVLAIDLISMDGTQSRATINEETVNDYAGLWLSDVPPFPPIKVFHDGKQHWLADGAHRILAAKRAKRGSIIAEVEKGTQRDALLYSLGANQNHGLRRTNEDKRHLVRVFLNDSEWVKWSDRKIADHAGVGHQLVAEIRRQVGESPTSPTSKAREGRDGKKYPMPKPKAAKGLSSISEKGRPGGDAEPSSPEPGEAADSSHSRGHSSDELGDAGETREIGPKVHSQANARTNHKPGKDYGKCPACAGNRWKESDGGMVCAKCGQHHGEPAGQTDEDRVGDARSKAVKTCEALMRALDDLNLLIPKAGSHKQAIELCKSLLKTAKNWK